MENVRSSKFIARQPAANIHHATRFAVTVRKPLNTLVTINFSELGVIPKDISRLFQIMIRHRFAPWLRRTAPNGSAIEPTYVWVVENRGGAAIHWAVYIPPEAKIAFQAKVVEHWATEIAEKRATSPQAVDIRTIYNIVGLKRYMLKGTQPDYAQLIGIRPSDQGEVIGKRSGFSKNLGPAARKRAGYKPRRIAWVSKSGQ